MRYLNLQGIHDVLKVSKIAIGSSMNMQKLTYEEKAKLYDQFFEAGGNTFDTARAYDGAEQLLGKWMKENQNRHNVIVSTKGGHPSKDAPDRSRLSLDELSKDIDQSLKALATDYIDIFWVHKDDESYPASEVVESVNKIIQQGKIRFIGCSNWKPERIEEANTYARENGLVGFMASQIQWSFAKTSQKDFDKYQSLVMTDEIYKWHQKNRMPVFAYSSQAQGFFSKAEKDGIDSISDEMRNAYASSVNLERLNRVKAFSKERNVEVAVPVLGYLLNNSVPCVAVIGARSEKMLEQSLKAVDFIMTQEEIENLLGHQEM